MWTCRRCGSTVTAGVCGLCGSTEIDAGHTLPAPSPSPVPPLPELREVPAADTSPPRSGRVNTPLIVGGIVAAVAVVGVLGGVLSVSGQPAASSAPRSAASMAPAAPPATQTGSRPATTRPATTGPAGGGLVTLTPGTWFTVIESLPKSEATLDAASARASQLGTGRRHPTVVVDTDAHTPHLTPGYWAVGVPGASTRAESVAICAEYGIAVGGGCYPRQIGS